MDSSTPQWVSIIITLITSALTGIATSFLTLGKYKEKVDQLEKRNDGQNEKLEQLGKDVAVIQERLQNVQKSIDNLVSSAQAHSPIQLTDQGWKMVKNSGAYEIFEKNRDKYLKELEAMNPRSQYDVQEKAYRIMGDKFNSKEFQPVEQWAFNNGKTMDEIIRILGYPLRDYYFEKHPEIVNPKEKY